MIQLNCTNCRELLTIDDAFAGGVCRCQFCGTIQTVPANLKQGGRPSTPIGSSPGTQKTLYQRQSSANRGATSTGVPAETAPTKVAETRTARAAQPVATTATSAAKQKMWLIGVGIGVAAAIVIGVIAWMAS